MVRGAQKHAKEIERVIEKPRVGETASASVSRISPPRKRGAAKTPVKPPDSPDQAAIKLVITFAEEVHKVDLWVADKRKELPEELMLPEQIGQVLGQTISGTDRISVADVLQESRIKLLSSALDSTRQKLSALTFE
jgi:hypothetical protein